MDEAELLELARSDSGVLLESGSESALGKKLPATGSFFSKFVILKGLYFSSFSLSAFSGVDVVVVVDDDDVVVVVVVVVVDDVETALLPLLPF